MEGIGKQNIPNLKPLANAMFLPSGSYYIFDLSPLCVVDAFLQMGKPRWLASIDFTMILSIVCTRKEVEATLALPVDMY